MIETLENIILRSYEIFGKYTIGKTLEVCKVCCVTDEQEKELVNTRLKNISSQLLQNAYYNSARSYTDRELWEMKHFLPRVLELVTDFDFPSHSLEITFTRLDLDMPENWQKEEIDLLANFSTAFFNKCLQIYPLPNNESIDNIILMFGIAYFDLTSILNVWLECNDIQSIQHLKDLILNRITYKNTEPYKLVNSFSTEETDKFILNWINDKNVKNVFSEYIENIIIQDISLDEKSKDELSWTYEFLKS